MFKKITILVLITIILASTFITTKADDDLPICIPAEPQFVDFTLPSAGEAKIDVPTFEIDESNTVMSNSEIDSAFGVDEVLVQSFITAGVDPMKAIACATLYTRLSKDLNFTENLKIAFLCQVMKEGLPGQYELAGEVGSASYNHWHSSNVTDTQRSLAGTCINNPLILSVGSSIPNTALIGCGMMQWTGDRRASLHSSYIVHGLNSLSYISPYDLAVVESEYTWMEMQDPYYNRIINWASGKSLEDTVKLVCRVYIGQTSQWEQDIRCSYISTIQMALFNYYAVKGGVVF